MLYNEFKRCFSLSMHKNMKINMGQMNFSNDFTDTSRGNLYPVIEKSDDGYEKIEGNSYFADGKIKRMFCRYFPYASYQIEASVSSGKAGFSFVFPNFEVEIVSDGKNIVFTCGKLVKCVALKDSVSEKTSFCVTCRPCAFDIYSEYSSKLEYVCSFEDDMFGELNDYAIFSNSYVCLYVDGNAKVTLAESFIDNGVAIADIRPIRYENSKIMTENGKIYFTASIRGEKECFQGVFSWIPGTAEIELTGALFYDAGDGKWCGDVAASILYDRNTKMWYLWVCSFSHGHILAHSKFEGDPRFGVNVIDVSLMEKAESGAKISEFHAFQDDEDPDFFYDEKNERWLMSICRINPETRRYSYVFFESHDPFEGYKYIGKGPDGCETGGSFVLLGDEIYFVCGNDFDKKSDYRIYSSKGMTNARFDFPDGGFRGWGTVIPIKQGSRTRIYWLTFDRTLGSNVNWNWSYGNLYCFETQSIYENK